MLKRPNKGTFKSMHVFPGGAIDNTDSLKYWSQFNLNQLIKSESELPLVPFKLAAIRETFEETGILLTNRQPDASAVELDEWREKVHADPSELATLCKHFGVIPSIDTLTPVSRWITPEYMKRRFDTVFFAAPAPTATDLQPSIAKGGHQEAVSLEWNSPERWLQLQEDEIDFMPPQFYLCHIMDRFLPHYRALTTHLGRLSPFSLPGYLPEHTDIAVDGVDLPSHGIRLADDARLFYTVLLGDHAYGRGIQRFDFDPKEIGGDPGPYSDKAYHRILGIKSPKGMKMIRCVINLPLANGQYLGFCR